MELSPHCHCGFLATLVCYGVLLGSFATIGHWFLYDVTLPNFRFDGDI